MLKQDGHTIGFLTNDTVSLPKVIHALLYVGMSFKNTIAIHAVGPQVPRVTDENWSNHATRLLEIHASNRRFSQFSARDSSENNRRPS